MPNFAQTSQKSNSSTDYFEEEDSQFLQVLETVILPGDVISSQSSQCTPPPPPPAQCPKYDEYSLDVQYPILTEPSLKRRRVEDEVYREREPSVASPVKVNQIPQNDNDTYGPSNGDFGQYMRRKRAKLQIQNAEISSDTSSEVKSRIFEGISIYVNGWTNPSIQELRRIVIQHGGIFQPYLDRKSLVTHIITNTLTPAKIKEFKYMKVVRPEWITESLQAGFLLSWKDYIYVHGGQLEAAQGVRVDKQSTIITSMPIQQSVSINSKQPTSAFKPPVLNSKSSVVKGKAISKPSKPSFVTKDETFRRAVELVHDRSRKVLMDHHLQKPRSPVEDLHIANQSRSTSGPVVDPKCTTDPQAATSKGAIHVSEYSAFKSNTMAERVMANPEWRNAHTSVAPDFVEGFYRNSRLHYLSTWKAELKSLVQEAQERAETFGIHSHGSNGDSIGKIGSEAQPMDGAVADGSSSGHGAEPVIRLPSKWKGKQKAVDDQTRVIMHCDFDCFFVSVGLTTRPHLKGKPVVVCHSQGVQGGAASTSEVASASYEARNFGIKNGMSLQQARTLCPSIITIPYEFEKYKQISLNFYTILMTLADDLQAVSVDEALIDVTSTVSQQRGRIGSEGSQIDPAKDFAETIRAQVRKMTNCEVSIGISHNIMLARLATRKAKPAGSFHLAPEQVPGFIAPLNLADLHGFGWATEQKAQEKLGTSVLGELLNKSKGALCDALGKGTGETIYKAIRGIDDKKIESDKPRKSVSCDINYGIRFENNEQAEAFMYQMAVEIKRRLDAIDMVGRSLTLKIMKRDPAAPVEPPKFMGHGACDLFSKNIHLLVPGGRGTSDDQIIGEHAWRLLKSFNFDPKELRGIGIQIQKLEPASGAVNTPAGQALLHFKKAAAGPSNALQPEITVQPPSQNDNILMAEGVCVEQDRNLSTEQHDLPSLSQVDHSVLEALPRDIREEIEKEYKRRSASPFVLGFQEGQNDSIPGPGPATLARERDEKEEFKMLAKRFLPRRARGVVPLHLFRTGKFIKKKKTKRNLKVANRELKKYDIDPDVFRMLPIKIQREQLIVARLVKQNKGNLPAPPSQSQKHHLKARKPNPVPEHLRWVAPPPKAKYKETPSLRQQGKGKEKLHFTETDDIQNVLEKWVTAYQRWSPKEKDVEFLSKYLLKSVDSSIASDVGVERAVAVMKWWMVLLRRFWPGGEFVEEGEPDGSQTDRVAEAWWNAFRDVKTQMDVVARRKFGGKLSLK
ncbi:hypothetical protein BDQ17DRAFT_1421710 [Cyathus striatus]|nr:hypothetical protein BDQ17DRAFT_1421710 [Cyathus striatus]